MDQILYILYTVAFVALSVWAGRLMVQSRHLGTLLVLIVMLAMVYENAVLALGVVIGHGDALFTLTWGRFIGYAVFPPLLIVSTLALAERVGVPWAGQRRTKLAAWAWALGLIAFALLVEVLGRELVPRELNGVVRYMWATKGIPPLAVIFMNLTLIGLSVAIGRRSGYWALLLGCILLFVGNGAAAGLYVLGSSVELLFMGFIVASEAWVLGYLRRGQQEARPQRAAAAGD